MTVSARLSYEHAQDHNCIVPHPVRNLDIAYEKVRLQRRYAWCSARTLGLCAVRLGYSTVGSRFGNEHAPDTSCSVPYKFRIRYPGIPYLCCIAYATVPYHSRIRTVPAFRQLKWRLRRGADTNTHTFSKPFSLRDWISRAKCRALWKWSSSTSSLDSSCWGYSELKISFFGSEPNWFLSVGFKIRTQLISRLATSLQQVEITSIRRHEWRNCQIFIGLWSNFEQSKGADL